MHRILLALVILTPILAGVLSACFVFDEPEPLTPEEQARLDTDRALVERWKYARFEAAYEIAGLEVPATALMSNDGAATQFTINAIDANESTTQLTMDHDGMRDRACERQYAKDAVYWHSEKCNTQSARTDSTALLKLDDFRRPTFASEDPSFSPELNWPVTCYVVSMRRNLDNAWHECYTADGVLAYGDGFGAMAYLISLRERFTSGSFALFSNRRDDDDAANLGWPADISLGAECCTFRATRIEPR